MWRPTHKKFRPFPGSKSMFLSVREETFPCCRTPLGSSEGNNTFKNVILGGGRNKTNQLCLNILRLSLRVLHQFFFSLQKWNKIDKVNFFTLKFSLSLVFLSKENCILLQSGSPLKQFTILFGKVQEDFAFMEELTLPWYYFMKNDTL